MAILVKTENLTVRFGDQLIVNKVSLSIPDDGITVLLGRSGSGKTTFLRSLNRLNECFPDCHTSGSAWIRLGQSLHSIYQPDENSQASLSELRRHVGMVFQTPNVLPVSISQNMLMPLTIVARLSASEARDRMRKALEDVGLWKDVEGRLELPAGRLSGGQQQRLCLARAMALEPNLLLLDEPTASLDPATTREIEDLLLRLNNKWPLMLVSHGLRQARRLASRLVFFQHGQARLAPVSDLPEDDSVEKLFEDDNL